MKKSLVFKILLILLLILSTLFFYSKLNKKKQNVDTKTDLENNEAISSGNVIKDVNYSSKDSRGNKYVMKASEGQVDLNNTKTIFLTDVKAYIRFEDSSEIKIISNFGKYNIDNYDTIFSKNVIITYADNKIKANYVDFSLTRNSMIISKEIVYTNKNNMLKADVIEINIENKDTKIYMYEQNNKVNIKSKK